MFGLAHGSVLLAPTEDALGHRPRRDCDMPYPGCRVVRSSMALLRVLPVLVTALFCVTCGVTLLARRLDWRHDRPYRTPCPHRP
jgi:hypothetical protein